MAHKSLTLEEAAPYQHNWYIVPIPPAVYRVQFIRNLFNGKYEVGIDLNGELRIIILGRRCLVHAVSEQEWEALG